MNNAHVHPLFAEILGNAAKVAAPAVKPSLTYPCPACWNSDNGSSGCVQCCGRGRVATNGGEA